LIPSPRSSLASSRTPNVCSSFLVTLEPGRYSLLLFSPTGFPDPYHVVLEPACHVRRPRRPPRRIRKAWKRRKLWREQKERHRMIDLWVAEFDRTMTPPAFLSEALKNPLAAIKTRTISTFTSRTLVNKYTLHELCHKLPPVASAADLSRWKPPRHYAFVSVTSLPILTRSTLLEPLLRSISTPPAPLSDCLLRTPPWR